MTNTTLLLTTLTVKVVSPRKSNMDLKISLLAHALIVANTSVERRKKSRNVVLVVQNSKIVLDLILVLRLNLLVIQEVPEAKDLQMSENKSSNDIYVHKKISKEYRK